MNIPDKIKIGGFEVNVEFVENLMNDRAHIGEYHPRTQTIKIDKAVTKQQNEETLIHEILEAITAMYEIEWQHKDLSIMATVLYQVIRDNPNIFQFN